MPKVRAAAHPVVMEDEAVVPASQIVLKWWCGMISKFVHDQPLLSVYHSVCMQRK
jgi:hypothetical protein